MGNNACSKSPIRRDVRQFLPTSWDDLLFLERWAASRSVHFIRDKATLIEWFGPKRRQDVCDAVDSRKDYFTFPVCVNDFLAGFALVQQAPVLRKFEFISKLANTGVICSKAELLIAMYFGVRGIAKLKGSKLPQDKALRYIVNNVFDTASAMDWAVVIQKLMAVPDVVYFLSDLDMVLVENLETLIADQLHAMKELAAIEYEIGVAECMAKSAATTQSQHSHDILPFRRPLLDLLTLSNLRPHTTAQSKHVHVHNIDKCCRRIQVAFKPPVDGPGARNLSHESCRRLDVHEFQALVASATDHAVILSDVEAAHQLGQFPKDQLERIACSDVLRWIRQWVTMSNREAPPKWQVAATRCVDLCRLVGSWWGQKLSTVRDTFCKLEAVSPRDQHEAFDLDVPQESNYSFLMHIDKPVATFPDVCASPESPEEVAALAVRLQFKDNATVAMPMATKNEPTAGSTSDILDQMQLDDEEVLETGFPMAWTIEFLLWKTVTDEAAASLARVVGHVLNDPVVLEATSCLWQKANVSIVYGSRDHATKLMPNTASDKYYLRITFLTRHSWFGGIEGALHTDLATLVQALHVDLQLKNSWQEVVEYSRAAVHRLLRHGDDVPTTHSAQSMLFKWLDVNGDGELSLDEVNRFQQVLGQSVLGSAAQFDHLITSNSLPRNVDTGNLTAHGLDVYLSKFGGLHTACQALRLGCLNEIIHGTLSVAAAFNRRALSKLQSFLASCSPFHNVWTKWGLFAALQITDVSTELSFPSVVECIQYFWPQLCAPLVDVPGWLAFVLDDLASLLSTEHSHAGTSSCVHLLCAIQLSLQRYHIHAPDRGKTKGAAGSAVDPTAALTMQAIAKFHEAWLACESAVCGLQQVVASNRDVECRVEFDHFVRLPPRPVHSSVAP
ncbi:hypothetical protein H310_07010 [Aphanomyces invadans]|uniref:Uncharacterized protein n=1 Tax=Aphanomyces invadans TaxID=157072 RepID=A0A024U2D0_9STRA|nr:hypothetical protein H310_07010 [Aphanomyces invadans]ETW00365.1 hypothetical protein H310_07010 [Aphanomyces invadans]|eukprot:XP_008870500.1 hypothetical protein H310_07010 [Aphanomyces invadans]